MYQVSYQENLLSHKHKPYIWNLCAADVKM